MDTRIARSCRLRTGRWSGPGQTYLVTTTCRDRSCWFADRRAAETVARLHVQTSTFLDARLLAWVLMPDHWHALLQLGASDLSTVVHRFKTLSGHRANLALLRRGAIWQPSFHDHALRREESLLEAARYLVLNPVRAGLATSPGDYPFWDAVWLSGCEFAP